MTGFGCSRPAFAAGRPLRRGLAVARRQFRASGGGCSRCRCRTIGIILAVACLGTAAGLHASDRVGIYGIVDKVVFEPNADNPERVQIWGAFSIATRNDRDAYDPVQRGYLYFVAADDEHLARNEWKDLQSAAGTRKIVAFSSRFGQSVRVRAQGQEPQTPDKYRVGIGVQTILPDRDYAPIKALAALITR
jgi:hypothetical protein